MKPTMIKTETTKAVKKLGYGERGTMDAGGVSHAFMRKYEGAYTLNGRIANGIDLNAQVTVTDTREMTTDDLQVGDTWVYANEGSTGDWFNVMVGEEEYVQVQPCQPTKRYSLPQTRDPATLVDVEFEAEPVDEELTVPVHGAGEFEFCGMIGRRVACADSDFAWVEWDVRKGFEYPLPPDTPVTVRKPAAYDSIDDVSVGDVVVTNADNPGVVVGCDEYGVRVLKANGCIYREPKPSKNLTPARLTSVTWTPREEVTR